MNKLISKMKQSFAIFLIFTLIVAMFPGAVGAEENVENKGYDALIEETINNTAEYMHKIGVNSDWQAIGLHQAGLKVPESYHKEFYNLLNSQIVESDRLTITHAARLTLAAQAIGLNPTNINGTNLIKKMYESDGIGKQTNNAPIYALIAFDSGSFSIPDDAKWSREKTVKRILELQNEDDGWALFGDDSNVDMTAMALIALSNHKDQEGVTESIERAVSYLSAEQTPEGGFYDKWNGGVASEATAQVIIALSSLGIDSTSEEFTSKEGNLIDHILSFIGEDYGFKHLIKDSETNSMATEQALQALVAYKLYLSDGSKLYDFGKQESVEPKPEPGSNENYKTEVQIGTKTDLTSTKEVNIKDSKTKIVLPKGLHEGAKLTVYEPNEKEIPYKKSKLDLAGDWYDFVFEGNEGIDGTYELTLGVDETTKIDEAGIYHFNEKDLDWKFVESTIDYENHTLTATVDHFSVYGVFTKNELEKDEESEENKEKDEKDKQPESEKEQEDGLENNDDNDQLEANDGNEMSEGKATVDKDDENSSNDEDSDVAEKDDNLVTVSKETKNEDGKKLPETATNTYNFILVGILILSLGLIVLGLRKKVVTNIRR